MNSVQHIFPPSIFSNIAYEMFSYLFEWHDAKWNRKLKPAYFHFTPRPTSTKALLHWFQIARHGNYLQPFREDKVSPPTLESSDSGTALLETDLEESNQHPFPLSRMQCPFAMFYGTRDTIIDAGRLAKQARRDLPAHLVRHIEELEGYEHMDVLWSKDAHERVFTVILDIIRGASSLSVDQPSPVVSV